jgi:branched-chain amino acid transport system ATP-binding protein
MPPPASSAHSLTATQLTKYYGGVKALSDVSFALPSGQTLGVIGPNGSGKSTLLALVSGSSKPTSGNVIWDGQRIDHLRKHAVARLGIGRARQIPRPFRRLTVRQNLEVAANNAIRDRRSREPLVTQVLAECGLLARERSLSGELGLLDLKRLEVARALALNPRLLLLDEVAAGLIDQEVAAIADLIERIKQRGISIVIVEHVQGVIGRLADRAIVLDRGRVIAEGTPQEVAADSKVIEVYFGSSVHAEPRDRAAVAAVETRPNVLDVRNVSVKYGGLTALAEVNLRTAAGDIVGIIGANGAGKTTLCQAICGLVPCQTGTVSLFGADVSRMPAHARARRGLAICHEGRRLFTGMTVKENLELGGAFCGAGRRETQERLATIFKLFPILSERAHGLAGAMSGGQQQMLAIGRALMAHPKVLLLDELSLGLAPVVIEQLYGALESIRALGVSVMLVEQNTHRCLAVADRVYVLERGRISYNGSPAALMKDDTLRKAYFGSAV